MNQNESDDDRCKRQPTGAVICYLVAALLFALFFLLAWYLGGVDILPPVYQDVAPKAAPAKALPMPVKLAAVSRQAKFRNSHKTKIAAVHVLHVGTCVPDGKTCGACETLDGLPVVK